MPRSALIGSNGQLGSDIARLWPASSLARNGHELVSLTHADMDVTDPVRSRSVLAGIAPTLVINTAAFHRVDDCELQVMQAFQVNGLGVKNLAEICLEIDARLVHFSTDYVFSGSKRRPYGESDATGPISAYGISKLAGECFLQYLLPGRHLLVRTSGLYGVAGASGKGGNFVETMLRLAREGQPIRVVDDQRLSPTYTRDLAATLLEILALEESGTFHVTNAGECSWFEFASEIFAQLGLEPDFGRTTSAEYASPAKRPAYSVLENARLRGIGIGQPRPWREALVDYLRARGHLPG